MTYYPNPKLTWLVLTNNKRADTSSYRPNLPRFYSSDGSPKKETIYCE